MININMRCIEIASVALMKTETEWININMRCIEMPVWENALDVIDTD